MGFWGFGVLGFWGFGVVVVGGGVSHLPTLQNVTPDSPTLGIANNVTGEGNGKNYNDTIIITMKL